MIYFILIVFIGSAFIAGYKSGTRHMDIELYEQQMITEEEIEKCDHENCPIRNIFSKP